MLNPVYMWKNIYTKELNCFQGISMEKDFEVSAIDLLDLKYNIVCISRSPDSDIWIFFKNLEIVI